jgi:Amidohydrolase family
VGKSYNARMKTAIAAALALLVSFAEPTVYAQSDSAQPAIALVGGTLIDVSNSGHTAHDIPNAVVVIRAGKIDAAGPAASVKVPPDAKAIDYKGTYILPGLIDGFAGLNSQAQANAWLYMGVTTIVGSQDDRRGMLKLDAHPSPHIYPLDGAGFVDQYSFLFTLPQWSSQIKHGDEFKNLNEQETKTQIEELAGRGTRAIWIGQDLNGAQTKSIILECHKLGLITYGEFIATPYSDALKDGVDVLLHMSRYELGLIPARLQEPLLRDPQGAALAPAYAYLRQLDPADPGIVAYGKQISASRAALMPTLSLSYLQLPNHRNLWKEPVASILDPKDLHLPSDPVTGEATKKYASDDARHITTKDDAQFFAINRALQVARPVNLTGTGSPAFGTMPGISMHTELELLVRLGLTPREALAAGTSNYSGRFGWHELGLVEAGRRADLLALTADPTVDITNSRKIHSVILEGVILDRDSLLRTFR